MAQLTRRSFLAGTGGLALLGLLDACTGHHTSANTARADQAELLALLRRAVQASPDFLQQRAANAVASRDAATIVAFVRDSISVLPPWNPGDDPVRATRWGSRATLRGGSGSLRDRAELLVTLLAAAGFTATVHAAPRPAAIGLAELYQLRSAAFAPDPKLLAQAVKLLPKDTTTSVPRSNPAAVLDAPAAAAARAIAAALPAAMQQATLRTDLLPATVPVVVITSGSTMEYAYLLGNLAPSTTAPSGLVDADQASPAPQVGITVTGLTNPGPGSTTPHGGLVDLVTADWPADEVFGRQILLNFVPPGGGPAMLASAPEDQPIRVPVLRLQSDLPAYAAPATAHLAPKPSPSSATTVDRYLLPVTGSLITLQGDVLVSVNEAPNVLAVGSVPGPYGPIVSLSAADRTAAMSRVKSLAVHVTATRFTDIELDVAVLDASGATVPGLDATSFVVTENGTAVPAAVISNAAGSTRPRVFVAYDASGSVAAEWSSPAAKAAFDRSLVATLATAAAETPFDVQILGLGSNPQPDQWTAPSATTMLAAIDKADDFSTLWQELSADVIDQGVVAMIVVSDFVSLDDAATIPYAQRRLAAAGIPVFCLPIGKPDTATIQKIVALTGGTEMDPSAAGTASALANALKPLVARRSQAEYKLRYIAPISGPEQRTVTVRVAGGSKPSATGSYQVPAQPSTPPSFAGLYLTISINGMYIVHRHLAGLLTEHGGPIGDLDDPAAAAETRAAILGLTTIAVEPGSVTAAALTDDVLSSLQSMEPIWALPTNSTAQTLISTISKKGVQRVPGVFAALLQPAAADAHPAALPEMRVAILRERYATDTTAISCDLPAEANTIVPLGPDPRAAFAATLALSTRMGAAEAAVSAKSAFSQLAGKSVTFLPDAAAVDAFLATVPSAQQGAWSAVLDTFSARLRIVPVGGAVPAFWVVDPVTGATTAVLLDSSGGTTPCGNDWVDTMLLLNVAVTVGSIICQFAATVAAAYFCVGVAVANVLLVAASLVQKGTGASIVPGVIALGIGRTFGFDELGISMSEAPGIAGGIGNSILLLLAFAYGNPPLPPCP